MTDETEITAEIDGQIVQWGDHRVIMGAIYNDRHGRWKDGHMVRTSSIVSEDGDIVKTRNSTYRLIKKGKAECQDQ